MLFSAITKNLKWVILTFHKKQTYRGDYLKREAWTICRFKRGLGRKEVVGVFEGV